MRFFLGVTLLLPHHPKPGVAAVVLAVFDVAKTVHPDVH
jgi:hypothetical protein